jgi:hypothetical protein
MFNGQAAVYRRENNTSSGWYASIPRDVLLLCIMRCIREIKSTGVFARYDGAV